MSLAEDIKKIIAGEVDDSVAALAVSSRDASLFSVLPKVLAFPKNVRDMQELVRFADSRPEHDVSLTVRSGGSDMSGGPLSSSVVVNTQKYLNRIDEVHEQTVTVEPGAWYRDLEVKLAEKNLLLPTYPASKDLCTVGGMVANNCGGEKTLAYGKTADYVQAVKVILRDGQEYSVAPLRRGELKTKLQNPDFEGEIYRRLFKLCEENYEAIQKARPKVSKNSAGYALWDVWNRDKQIFNLTRLLSGSQGTLGILSEITFRLVNPLPHRQLLVISLPDLSPLVEIVKIVLIYSPESFESYDQETLRIAIRYLPQLLRKMKARSTLAAVKSFFPEIAQAIQGKLPALTLLAEFTGFSQTEVEARAAAAEAALRRFQVPMRLARNATHASKYWAIRHESYNLLREHAPGKHAACFIDDLIVRPEHLPEFLPRLQAILEKYHLTPTIAGHVGDGNFHIIPLMDVTRPDFATTIEKVMDEAVNLTFEFHGSTTAEHNDGLIRSHYLEKMFGKEMYSLFVEVKNIFDPHNIFNPGKKVGSDWQKAKQHLIKE